MISSPSQQERHILKPVNMQSKKPFKLYICLITFGFVCILTGIILIGISGIIYEDILRNHMVLKPGSTAYDMWVKNPLPMAFKIYLFNWTNPQDLRKFPEIKPNFEILGPYTYSETKEKEDIVWNANGTVTYKNRKTWLYDPEKTNGSLSDMITSVSPVALTAGYVIRGYSSIVKYPVSMGMNSMGHKIYSTHNVSQLLFEGYEDGLLKLGSSMTFLFKEIDGPKIDKFGWFYGRNGSGDYEGIYNVETGTERIGELKQFNFADRTPYYRDHCGRFANSSGGEFFPSRMTKETIVKLFSSDLCRYVELEFENEVVVHGIVGYKFAAFDRFLDNGTKIPENKCFCVGNCMPYGALNVSTCRHGSPAFVTLPHFYKADPYYLNAVEGLEPNKDKHDFFMIFEPKTGLPLQVSARLQLNLQLQSVSGISLLSDVPEVYMPVLYFDQSVAIPSNIAFLLKLLINFDVICTAIACILIAIGLFTSCFMCYKLCTTNIFDKEKVIEVKLPEEIPLNK